MPEVVRAALVQSHWTGDKSSMIEASVELAREAAAQGARIACFQELFFGPYFCQVQEPTYFSLAEPVPGGPITELMRSLAKELNMVLVVPVFEEEQPGVYYNTAFVVDADGTYLGKYRKTHIPQVHGFWEKYYFRPGNLGFPIFQTAVGPVGVYICYDRHFPEGWRAWVWRGRAWCSTLRPRAGASRRTFGGSSSRRQRSPTSTSSVPSTGSGWSRWATTTFTGGPTSSTRGASSSARPPPTTKTPSWCATSTWTCWCRCARLGPFTATVTLPRTSHFPNPENSPRRRPCR